MMSDKKFSYWLFATTRGLLDLISEKHGMTVPEAMELLYNSKFYTLMETNSSGYWKHTKQFLFSAFEREQKAEALKIREEERRYEQG